MGAPSCLVLFPARLRESDVAGLGSLLDKFGSVAPAWQDDWLEIEGSADVFGIKDAQEEGLPRIALRMSDDDPGRRGPSDDAFAGAVKRALGWLPKQYVVVDAFTSAPYNHAFVGRVSAELAGRYDGLIHLGTVCSLDEGEPRPELPSELTDRLRRFASRLHPEDRQDPGAWFRASTTSGDLLDPVLRELERRYEENVRKRVARMPGKVVELGRPGGKVDSYLVDPVFMQAWLRDPGFFIG